MVGTRFNLYGDKLSDWAFPPPERAIFSRYFRDKDELKTYWATSDCVQGIYEVPRKAKEDNITLMELNSFYTPALRDENSTQRGPDCIMCLEPSRCHTCAWECLQCSSGNVLSYDGKFCGDPTRMKCPISTGYFKIGQRCAPCSTRTPFCSKCTEEGECLECAHGMHVLKKPYGETCVSECSRGSYMDATTGVCGDCPSWCQQCNDGTCNACIPGLYMMQKGAYVFCVNACDENYYPETIAPMRCMPCHMACDQCWGPSEAHCMRCRFFGELVVSQKLALCHHSDFGTKRRRKREGATGLDTLIDMVDEGDRLTVYGRKASEEPDRARLVYSAFFYSIEDYQQYWAVRQEEKNLSKVELYAPFCQSEDCLDHCANATLVHPCPYCEPNYFKDFRGYCVARCPPGSFANLMDSEQPSCVMCLNPTKCHTCDWEQEGPLPLARKLSSAGPTPAVRKLSSVGNLHKFKKSGPREAKPGQSGRAIDAVTKLFGRDKQPSTNKPVSTGRSARMEPTCDSKGRRSKEKASSLSRGSQASSVSRKSQRSGRGHSGPRKHWPTPDPSPF
ncbi:unnamed protein product, partial [Mesorhabditis spiculigera]